MDFTDSRTCLVDHELVCAGFDSEDSERGCSAEADWESCSNHSGSGASSSAESGCPCWPSPEQLGKTQQHNHCGQPPPQHLSTHGGEEVMFYNSTKALWDSLAYITSLRDMCDVIFYVGKTRQPVYGVKSLLSVRSRVMYLKILQAQRTTPMSQKTPWKTLNGTDALKDGRVHIDVKDYDAKVFSHFINFLHSGRVKVHTDTAVGLYCASAEYEVLDLRTACWDFVERCAQRGYAYTLVNSGRLYLGRKCLQKLSRKFLRDV